MTVTSAEILEPLGGLLEFEDKIKGKKTFLVRFDGEPFRDFFTWKDFNQYLNGYHPEAKYSRVSFLNIVQQDGYFWANDKTKRPLHNRTELANRWLLGHTFILPVFHTWNEKLWNQLRFVEEIIGQGTMDIYCSPKKDCLHFPPRCDRNKHLFTFQIEGRVRYTFYKQFFDLEGDEDLEVQLKIETEPGDVIYIPKGQYYKMYPLEKSITAVALLREKDKNFKARKPYYKFEHEPTSTN